MTCCLPIGDHFGMFKVVSAKADFCLTNPFAGSLRFTSIRLNLPKCLYQDVIVSGTISFSSVVGTLTQTVLTIKGDGQVVQDNPIPVSLSGRLELCQPIVASDLTIQVPDLDLQSKIDLDYLELTCCATTCCDPFLVVTQGTAIGDATTITATLYFVNMSSTAFSVESIQVSIADLATPSDFTDVPVTIKSSTVIEPITSSTTIPTIKIEFPRPTLDQPVIIYRYELANNPASDPRVCQRGTGSIIPTDNGRMFPDKVEHIDL